ncbi:MAG: MBL fold metallo-hydrolase, partial [Sphingomonadales bacterium]|nr:MBL fold metallo-hydrolase [Sphingomonadales bacterium]
MGVKVKFCGAAGTVTGSCYWVQTDDCQFLVDCGLFQGAKTVKELNYRPFPFDPAKIDFVLLTHAHTDHTALVPKLIKAGFTGSIYTTPATRSLVHYMLPDSGYIQEMEVRRLNQRNQQRGRPIVQPIYTRKDAEMSIDQIRPVNYDKWLDPNKG